MEFSEDKFDIEESIKQRQILEELSRALSLPRDKIVDRVKQIVAQYERLKAENDSSRTN